MTTRKDDAQDLVNLVGILGVGHKINCANDEDEWLVSFAQFIRFAIRQTLPLPAVLYPKTEYVIQEFHQDFLDMTHPSIHSLTARQPRSTTIYLEIEWKEVYI